MGAHKIAVNADRTNQRQINQFGAENTRNS